MHRGIRNIQRPSGLGQSELTRGGKAGSPWSLLEESVWSQGCHPCTPCTPSRLLLSTPLTISVRQDLWISKMRLNFPPSLLVLRGEADNEGKPVLEPQLLRSRDNRDQARRMMKLEWLVPDRLPPSCKGLECEVCWGCLAYAAGQVVFPRLRAEALCRQHPHSLDFNPK